MKTNEQYMKWMIKYCASYLVEDYVIKERLNKINRIKQNIKLKNTK